MFSDEWEYDGGFQGCVLRGYEFVKTCSACPEQYDVYEGNIQVAYVRLRHGKLTVDAPDCGEERIFEASPNGDGCFDEEERLPYLIKIADVIYKHYHKDEELDFCPFCGNDAIMCSAEQLPSVKFIKCSSCPAAMTIRTEDNKEAIKIWNKRKG